MVRYICTLFGNWRYLGYGPVLIFVIVAGLMLGYFYAYYTPRSAPDELHAPDLVTAVRIPAPMVKSTTAFAIDVALCSVAAFLLTYIPGKMLASGAEYRLDYLNFAAVLLLIYLLYATLLPYFFRKTAGNVVTVTHYVTFDDRKPGILPLFRRALFTLLIAAKIFRFGGRLEVIQYCDFAAKLIMVDDS